MSSHCNKYPDCGCDASVGTKCQTLDQPKIKRNEKGYPLKEDGNIDWELAALEKQVALDKEERRYRPGKAKKPRFKPTNYTPPKKKRK